MRKTKTLVLMMGLVHVLQQAQASQVEPEQYIYSLWVNGVALNQDILVTQHGTDIELACQVLDLDYIDQHSLISKNTAGHNQCSLQDNHIRYAIDPENQALKLDIPLSLLKKNDLLNRGKLAKPQEASLGGYVNYNALHQYTDDTDTQNRFSLESEFAIFYDRWLFKNAMMSKYNHDFEQPNNTQHIRLYSNLSIEQPEQMRVLQFGDNVSRSLGLTQGFYFSGVQWGTNFMSRSDFVYWNVPTIHGSALAPSNIDLLINGQHIYQTKVNPGEFNLQAGAYYNGDGKAQIIVEDILGNKQIQEIDISVSDRVLKKGLSDYLFSAGRLRYQYAEASNDYRDYFGSAYYRYGLTEKISVGAQAQYSKELQNYGLMWSQYFPFIGALELSTGQSRHNQANGHSYAVALSRQQSFFDWGLSSQYYSQRYAMLGTEEYATPVKRESSAYIGINQIPYLGNISLNYVEQIQHQNAFIPDTRLFSLRGGRSLTRNLYFNYGLAYNQKHKDNLRFDVAFSYQFDHGKSAYLNHNKDFTSLSYNKIDSQNTGLDYKFGVGKMHDDNMFDVQAKLKTNWGDLDSRYFNMGSKQNLQSSYKGSVVWMDRSVALSKFVEYPFGLVEVENSPNIDIYRNNALIGKTNSKGQLFVHRLMPYNAQKISIDINQLDIEDMVETDQKMVVPLDLRGYRVNFPVQHTVSRQFKFITPTGQPLATGSLLYTDAAQSMAYPLDAQATVTLYGLSLGAHQFKIKTNNNQQCTVNIQLDAQQQAADTLIEAICE